MEIKELFEKAENGVLTYSQFESAMKEAKAKFVGKYNDDLAAKAKEIETLNGTISTRDTDLADLQKKLEEAGVDATKLQELTNSLTSLQAKYDGDTKAYKEQLKKQAYEFAVKEFTSSQKFSSSAAKRDFERSLLDKELKMDKGKILGADDFVKSYMEDNADAFIKEPEPGTGNNGGAGTPEPTVPHFIGSTQGNNSTGSNGGANAFSFNFTGVRPKPAD